MADRKISDLTEMPASGVASSDLFLVIDVDNPDINDRSQRFTASGLMDYVYQRLSIEGQDQRFYADVTNSTQRGFFGTVGLNTISGNTVSGGTVVNIASGVTLNFSNFQNQNLIKQDTSAPTDSGVILWYRPPVSGLLGRTYYRYINPTGVGPSAIEWVEASPFETTTIEIGTQQVISGIFNPLRIPAATNSPSGYGGIRFVDVEGQFLNASGEYTYLPVVTSGYVGGIPVISGVAEGLPLVKYNDTVIYTTLSGSVINTDFSSSQVRFARGTQSAPSITFTGDINTGLYSPTADQVGITVSGFEHFRIERNLVTISGALNVNNGVLTTEQDVVINSVSVGLGGSDVSTNVKVGDGALEGNTTGQWNIALGKEALAFNQGGSENVGLGFRSLYSVINGGSHVAIGSYALYSAVNNNNNMAIGYAAMYSASTGDSNVAIGPYSLYNNTASNNIGIGFEAGYNNAGGTSNTLIGYRSGKSLTTGNNNTIIGGAEGSAGLSDTIIIAAGTAEKIKIDSSNNVFLAGTVKTISGGTGAVPIYTTSGDPDTGIFFPSANTAGISVSGLGRIGVDINRVTVSGTFLATTISGTTFTSTLGTTSAPPYTFSGDLNTGIYSPAADRVGITVSGLTRLAVDINRTTVSGTFQADTISGTTVAVRQGSVTAPSYTFSGDLNTGIYSPSADVLAITSSGLQVVRFESDLSSTFAGPIYGTTISGSTLTIAGDLSAGAFVPTGPTIPANGLYLPFSNHIAFSTDTSEKARIDFHGNLKIGGTAERTTTSGTRQLILYNGTAPVGTLSSGISLYASGGEFYSMNAGGTGTLVLNSSNFNTYAPTLTGTGASGSWGISITGSSASTTGNAATATALSSARNFTVSGEITGTASSDLTSGVTINTVIAAGVIDNSNVNAAAAIEGTKIAPDFGSQNIVTTGSNTSASFIPTGASVPTNGLYLPAANTVGIATGSSERWRINGSGQASVNTATALGQFHISTGTLSLSSANITAGLNVTNTGGTAGLDNYSSGIMLSKIASTRPGAGIVAVQTSADEDQLGLAFLVHASSAPSDVVVEGARLDHANRLKIGGTADRATTAGTNQLVIFNGNAPVGTLSNGFSLYSTSGNPYVMTSAGTAVQLGPSVTADSFIPTSSTVPTNGLYLPAANTVGIATGSSERFRIDGSGRAAFNGATTGSVQVLIGGTVVSSGTVSRLLSAQTATVPTASTGEVSCFYSGVSTQDGIAAVANISHYVADQGTVTGGTRTAPTAQHGFRVRSSLTGATSNYGFTSQIAAGSGRWNFYAEGTAENYFAGATTVASTLTANSFIPTSSTVPTNGLYLPAANTVGIAANSTSRLQISSSGQFLFNTTSLRGVSTSTLPQVQFESSTINATFVRNSGDNIGAIIALGHSRTIGGAIGVTSVNDGDQLGAIRFAGADGTTIEPYAAQIQAQVDGTPGTNDMPGRLVFSTTADGASSPTERMRIDSAGNVNIGTTGITASKLHIEATSAGATTIPLSIRNNSGTANTAATIDLSPSANAPGVRSAQISAINNGSNQISLAFLVSNAASPAEAARFTETGNLLINASSSAGGNNKLQVRSDTGSNAELFTSVTSSQGPTEIFSKARGTSSAPTVVASADEFGSVTFRGYSGAAAAYVVGAKISAFVDGTPDTAADTSDMPGRIVFFTTADGAGTETERMRIASTGQVLIATTGTGNNADLQLGNTNNDYGTTSRIINAAATFGTTVVTGHGIRTSISTAAAGSITALYHFLATQGTINTAPINQMGFLAESSLTGGTNNFGFYSNIAAATGRWNFYAAGTAENYFAGVTTVANTLTATSLLVNSAASYNTKNYLNSLLVPQLQIHGTTQATSAIGAHNWGATSSGPSQLILGKSRGASIGTNAIVSSGDDIGALTFVADDGAGFIPAASVLVEVDGTPGTNDMPGRLVFSTTADGASSPTERMRIDSAGNVGIGTTPSTLLHISSATGTATPTPTELRIATTNNASDWSTTDPWGRISFYNNDTSGGGPKIHAAINCVAQSSIATTSALTFAVTSDTTNTLTDVMRLDFAGRVLIGTTSPATKLTVADPVTANSFIPTSSTVPTNGLYLPAANTVGIATNSVRQIEFSSTGIVNLYRTDGTSIYSRFASTRNSATWGGNQSTSFEVRPTFDFSGSFVGAIGIQSGKPEFSNATTGDSYSFFRATNEGGIAPASLVESAYGLQVDSNIVNISSANVYGIYSSIASAANRWNFYAAGTAENYFAGATTVANTLTANSFIPTSSTVPTNGLYLPAANTVGIATGSSGRVLVDSSGRLVIGSTSALTIFQDAGLQNHSTGINSNYSMSRWSNDATPARLILGKSRGTSVGISGIVASGTNLGVLTFVGDDGTGFVRGAEIIAAVDNTPGTNDMPGRLVFSTTADGASSPTERMRIDNAGTVLIATSSSRSIGGVIASLQLEGATNFGNSTISLTQNRADNGGPEYRLVKSRGTAVGNYTIVSSGDRLGNIRFFGADGTADIQAVNIEGAVDNTPGTNDMPGRLVFSTTADGASSPTERMRIDSAGNVGIGATTLSDLLTLRGGSNIALRIEDTVGTYGRVVYNDNGTTAASLSLESDGGNTTAATVTDIRFSLNGTVRATLYNTGNFKIGGTANRATTEGTNQLVIFNGTAPVGTLTNGVSLYSATGELRVMDAAGNSTLLSPHDEQNYWVYDSTDTTTGKRLKIDMEKMMKFLNEYFGLDFVQETFVQT